MKREFRIQNSEFRIQRKRLGTKVWTLGLLLVTCHLSLVTAASGGTHVTATYDLGANPRVMATVGGQPQYGLVFAQRNKAVTYQSVEYGPSVVKGYLNASGQLNDGAGNLWLDLIPNLGATPADSFYVVTFNIQGRVHAEIWVVPDLATVGAEACRQAQAPSSTAPALFYQFLQQGGEGLPQRQKLNLIGSGVTCLDNAGQLRTDCTFAGGGGSAPIASATVSGTVKTDTTVADPVVYLQTSADTLLAGKVPTSRSIGTSSPLAGGGALTADLALSCPSCEVTGNKDAASGYAGLTPSTKLNAAQGQEVWGLADLTDVASTTGTGTAAVLSTNPTLTDVTIDDVANFNETAGDATCSTGDTWIKFNSTAGKFRKCEDGSISDLDTGGGGGASTGDAFVTVGHPADLTAERNLAGTSSEIVVTDGGANSDVTLSLDASVAQEDVANIFTQPQTINVLASNTALSGKRVTDTGCVSNFLRFFKADGTTVLASIDCEGRIYVKTDVDPSFWNASGVSPILQSTTDYVKDSAGSSLGLFMGAATGNTFGQIKVLTGGGTAWGDLILQSGGGKVGIGDLSPSTTLEVDGTVTAPVYQSTAADPADTGELRLGNNQSVCFETSTPGTDKCMKLNTSDETEIPTPAKVVGASTDPGILTLGLSTSTTPSYLAALGGDGASNAEAPYIRLIPSPNASGDDTYIYPSSTGGRIALSSTQPAADPSAESLVMTAASTDTVKNKTLDNSNQFSGYTDWAEIAAPGSPSAGKVRAFAKSGSGELCAKSSAGVETCMSADLRSVTYIAGADNASTALADADDQNGFWVNELGRTYRVTRVWVQSDGGTPSINLQRDDGSATNILTSNLSAATGNGACADSSGSTMTIRGTSITCSNLVSSSERDIAAGDVLNFVMGTAGGTAKRVTVNIQLTAQ